MFKKLNLLLAASLASASVFAAYGPAPAAPAASSSNWTLGVGYGQMFSMKKTTTGTTVTASVDKPTLLEVDLFHNNGFGAVYMTSAKKKSVIANAAAVAGGYSFNGYFLGYQKGLAANMTGRVLVGLSDQKYNTTFKSSGKFAFGASGAYNMNLSGKLNGFAELGYLNQKKFQYDTTNYVSGTGFYWKLGVKMPI